MELRNQEKMGKPRGIEIEDILSLHHYLNYCASQVFSFNQPPLAFLSLFSAFFSFAVFAGSFLTFFLASLPFPMILSILN